MININGKEKNNIILVLWWLSDKFHNCVVDLEKKGFNTVIIDDLSNSCLSTYRKIGLNIWYKPDFYEINIDDYDSLENIFKKYNFSWIINFINNSELWINNLSELKKIYLVDDFNLELLNK